jgi:hypothetical protein
MSSTCPVLQFHPEFFLVTSYMDQLPLKKVQLGLRQKILHSFYQSH